MSNLAPKHSSQKVNHNRFSNHSRLALSARACSAILAGTMLLGGGLTASLAYADGYVDNTGNNVYYGFKTDAKYAEAHFTVDVEYYDTFDHAKAGGTEGIDPLGKFVRVHYLSNCNNDATADDWKFRPMWWFGVPAGLKDPQDIQFKRIEKLTKNGKQQVKPAGSSQYITTDANGYGAVSDKHFNSPKEWTNISNYYFSDEKILASKGWKQLMGLDTKDNKGYDNAGNTAQQWEEYQKQTQGLKGIFVDWESAGQRWYDMTYIAEMEDKAWKERDTNPLRFAAGVYRFAGNWHYAVGQKHNTPKIADHLTLAYPEVTKVKKTNDLSDAEQKAIKEKIEKANENTKYFKELVADNGVVVNKDGSATITFKDKTTRTIPASLLVAQDESDSDRYKPIMPARTPVVNPSKLTDADKTAVIAAFKKANEKNKNFNDHVKSGDDGIKFNDDGTKLIVTYQDGSKIEIDASELVCQGATIADWAPYVVPDYIEVDDLKKLSDTDVTAIVNAFDAANKGITPYDDAKGNGDKAPVTVDKATGAATITWKDGSTTTIAAWQFLKEKAKQNPEPSTPTQQGDKTFIVEAPKTQSNVDFDPFNVKESDLTANEQALSSIKGVLNKCKAKDAKDSNTAVTIKSVEFKLVDGKGVVIFHADNYKDATYPMSVFLKQKTGKQTPQTPSTETKTETDNDNPGNTFTYKVTKTEIDGNNPTAPDAIKAMKQFVKDNYDNVKDSDLDGVSDSISIKTTWTPKQGTVNMGAWDNTSNCGPVTSIQPSNDLGIQVNGHQWEDDDNGGGWSAGMEGTLFTIQPNDLYVKKGSTQPSQDNTIDKLKEQAKALLKQRQDDGLTNDDLKRAGIKNADQLNNDKIDGMSEKELRDLIRKLTDAKKAERKYNPIPEIEVADPENLSEDDFKKAAEAFLKANYDGTDSLAVDKVPYTVPTSLKPKTDTVLMEPASDTNATGISTIKYTNSDFKTLIFSDKNKNQLFTVSVTYKKKAETPAPTPDALAQMKKDAEQQIDRNPNLTKEQKEEYKKQIEEATTPDKIKEILNNAAQQGKDNQNDPSKAQTITDNKGGGNAKKEAEDKKQKEEDEHNKQKLQKEKTDAKNTINSLANLTDGDSGDKKKLSDEIDNAQTPEEVKNILEKAKAINDARGALKEGALPFLSHGNANSDDDKALKELIGADPAQKDSTLTDLDKALTDTDATADSINKALDAAKRQNAINEQNAKNAGLAKLEAKKAELDAAYNALNDEQKAKAKDKYEAATKAIDDAKNTVNSATKPSEIKGAVDGVKASFDAANKTIEDAKGKRDTSQNTYDDQSELDKEKEAQKKRIQDSNLPDADKQKAIDDINNAKKIGDPTGIANRALKAQKIEDAKKQIAALDHLNNAQKEAFKKIIEDTDASDHTNADGTTSDDIDDALANATNTDNAMARLEELKIIADEFAKGEKYKNGDPAKKTAFDDASTAAGAVLDKAKGDPKDADQVNELYNDLLKAMRDIDPNVKSAGLKTDALAAEVETDKKFKPDTTANPATSGNSVYNTSSKDKKDAFDKALGEAQTVLNDAKNADISTADNESKEQKKIDDALDKLIKARLALDGVNTDALQAEVTNDGALKDDISYKNASQAKKDAFDKALKDAQDLIANLNGDSTMSHKEKQDAVDKALQTLKDAAEALDGVDTDPLQNEVNASGDVKQTDTYTNADKDKKAAYDAALEKAQNLLKELAQPDADTRTKEQKEQALKAALDELVAAKNALNGQPTQHDGDSDNGSKDSADSKVKSTPQTSDPFALGQALASLLGSAGILGAGLAKHSKRSAAKHMKRKK